METLEMGVLEPYQAIIVAMEFCGNFDKAKEFCLRHTVGSYHKAISTVSRQLAYEVLGRIKMDTSNEPERVYELIEELNE